MQTAKATSGVTVKSTLTPVAPKQAFINSYFMKYQNMWMYNSPVWNNIPSHSNANAKIAQLQKEVSNLKEIIKVNMESEPQGVPTSNAHCMKAM